MARLTRVRPGADPGFMRAKHGAGFRYCDAAGEALGAAELERVKALVIPPAWRDVWICADARGHIQAVGTDDAGRRQYLYHEQWTARRGKLKFTRALELAAALPRARARVTASLRSEGIGRERVLAVAFRLLDEASPRIGSEQYFRKYGSRGLTTLQRRDVDVDGDEISLSFPAKGGVRAVIHLRDADLAAALAPLTPGRGRLPLLAYARGRRRVALTSAEVNSFVREVTGGGFTAKDFRTLRGTVLAAQALARIGVVDDPKERERAHRIAVQATAEGLGNTPAVARASYIDPRVFERHAEGHLLDGGRSPESAVRALVLGR